MKQPVELNLNLIHLSRAVVGIRNQATTQFPDVDYPAAHSMDTDWFALDQHGNVGLFSTSDWGAVPLNANISEDLLSVLRVACLSAAYWATIQKKKGKKLAALVPCAIASQQKRSSDVETGGRWTSEPCRVLFFKGDNDRLNVEDRSLFAPIGPVFMSIEPLTDTMIRRVAATGVQLYDIDAIAAEIVNSSRIYNVFEFGHSEYEPGLYARRTNPKQPINAKDLPWSGTFQLRLPIDFSEACNLHLADFMEDKDAFCWEGSGNLRERFDGSD